MNICEIAVSKIRPAKYNPRKDLQSTDPAYQRLKKAVDCFGLVEPLVWNERTGNLVGGHQRFKILKERGDEKITVSVVSLDEREEKALNLALNKHSGEWDFSSLADLVQELDVGDFDMEIAGFGQKELEQMATWGPDPSNPANSGSLTERYAVLVECETEVEQSKLLAQFTKQKLKCKALIV